MAENTQAVQTAQDEILGDHGSAVWLLIWAEDSPNPGYIDHGVYLDHHIPGEHNYDEVVGVHRTFVEVDKGSEAWKVFVDPGSMDLSPGSADWALTHLDMGKCYYDWATEKFVWTQVPPPSWDDVKTARDTQLQGSDSAFNFDTPEPLRSEWMFYREQLRQLIPNEKANGRTPGTVHYPIPPWPRSARLVGEHEPEIVLPTMVEGGLDTTPGQVVATIDARSNPTISTIVLHRPANIAKYGKVAKATAGGVDLDTDLLELAKQIRQEVTDCLGVPGQSIAPTNRAVHVGDPAFLENLQKTLSTDAVGNPSVQSNTFDNPTDGLEGVAHTTETAANQTNGS
jgi:hypothetical protein